MKREQLAYIQGQLVAAREVLESAGMDAMEDDDLAQVILGLNVALRTVIADIAERLA